MAITATFQANFEQFVAAVRGATASLDGIKTTAQTVGTAVAASLATAEIRRFAGDVQTFAKEFIGAYAEQEAATSRLMTALKAQGTFTPTLQRAYADLAEEFQRTTRFSDDAITGIEALLVQVGGVLPSQMGTALKAITNLAAGMGPQVGGLEGAALLVAKAFSSDGESLGKLKVILGDAIGPTANMEQVMAALNKKFGGQAAADIETSAGQMAQFANKANDAQETVGKLLITVLTPLADFFQSMPESMQAAIVAFGVIGTAVAPLVVSFSALAATLPGLIAAFGGAAGLSAALSKLTPFLGPAGIIAAGIASWFVVFKNLDVFVWAAVTSWEALTKTFTASVAAITGSAKAIYDGIKTWLVDRFTGIMSTVKGYIDTILGWWRGLQATIGGALVAPAAGGVVGSIPSFSNGSGGFRDFGSGTLAMLHGREAVIPAAGASGMMGGTFTFNLYGTPESLVQQVKDVLTRDILQGRKVAA